MFATKLVVEAENMLTIFSQDLLKDHVYIMGKLCPIIWLATIIHTGFSGCTAKPKKTGE